MEPTTTGPVAVGVPAPAVIAALRELGATQIVTVPDTHQRTVLDGLAELAVPVIRAATEDDVLGICAGLWMGGARPVALIQQLGLFASVNALRAFTHDQHVPLAIIAGLYGRDVDVPAAEDAASAVRLIVPVLDALGVRHVLVDDPAHAGLIGPTLRSAFDEDAGGPRTAVVLLGAPTT